ncbi:hypothetical protein [Microlunatus soli]|uniref:Uncharacterized protein n=1 Tax=Microlunatus soli TaxID=630515 RepID=A0A1H2APD9_9ACTN|nr:hypothetical protein [Microlunatus soli]SDT47808.1 hypothetical protein SAMN04489812_6116 [Microlunatus soli]
MGLLDRLRGRGGGGPDPTIVLDLDARREQLQALEQSLDALARLMREREDLMVNPGWRAKITEYDLVAGEAMQLRRGTPTREAILDLAFEVRPAVKGEVPAGLEQVAAQQEDALAAANRLAELLPGERR